MPILVARSESLVRHWTRSSLNRAVMTKTLLLLLLMVLILPSLGLTSAQAFLEWTVNAANDTGRWDCVFLPDQVTNILKLIRYDLFYNYDKYNLYAKNIKFSCF